MTKTKTLTGYLIANWRDEDLRYRKTKMENPGPYEIQVPVSLDVTVPQVDVDELSSRLEVPRPSVEQATAADIDAEDFPDWHDTAEEAIEFAWTQRADALETHPVPESLLDELVGRTVVDAPGVPNPESVRGYLKDRLHDDCTHE